MRNWSADSSFALGVGFVVALARSTNLRGRSLIDARPQTGTASDEQTEMRYPTRASELVYRRLQVPALSSARYILYPNLLRYAWRGVIAYVVLDLGHQRFLPWNRGRAATHTTIRSRYRRSALNHIIGACKENVYVKEPLRRVAAPISIIAPCLGGMASSHAT